MCGGSLFGSKKVEAPKVQQVAPAPTVVSNSDIGASGSADAEAARQARRKRGFASTQLSNDRNTVLANATSGRSTLG